MKAGNKQIFVVYLTYFLCMLAFVRVRIVSSLGFGNDWDYYAVESFYTLLIQVIIMVVMPLLILKVFAKKSNSEIKTMTRFRHLGIGAVGICLVLGVAVFFGNIAISSVWSSMISLFGYSTPVSLTSRLTPSGGVMYFVFDLVATAIFPGICEEFLHRGVLLGGTEKIGYKKSIVISSILFGLLHFSINKVFYAAVLGLVMGFVVVITNNIWCSVIIHFVNNAINVYIAHAQLNGWFGGNFYSILNSFLISNNMIVTFVCCLVFLTIVVSLMLYLIYRLYRRTTVNNVNRALTEVYNIYMAKNIPVTTEVKMVVRELVETKCIYNIHFNSSKNPVDFMLPRQDVKVEDTIITNLFLISSVVLGVLITIFTFIWGLL